MVGNESEGIVAQRKVIRSCGACMMCCKLFPVRHFNKPAGVWCKHAKPGQGCTIHETRPTVCRAFQCEWTINSNIGEDWRPDKVKFFIYSPYSNQLMLMVDPAYPQAWKAESVYATIKLVASELTERGGIFTVCIGQRRIVVLPDRDEDLGMNAHNRYVEVVRYVEISGVRYEVRVGEVKEGPNQEPV